MSDDLRDPIDVLAIELGRRAPFRAPAARAPRAAVALLLRPAAGAPELLVIQRAIFPGDPWSGHMALPGGRMDPGDADPFATAVRETREEVGIDLEAVGRALGPLGEVHPAAGAPSIVVHPYVFAVPATTEARPNREVQAALWLSLDELAHPDASTEHVLETLTGDPRRFPAIGVRGRVIWGLTHRILAELLDVSARSRSLEDE